MGQLTNQIRVLLQRVKMAGREPHKILMHQGLKEALYLELEPILVRKNTGDPYAAKQGAVAEFEGIPIVVDNSVTEILIQVKPLPYATKELPGKIDWKKINKFKRF